MSSYPDGLIVVREPDVNHYHWGVVFNAEYRGIDLYDPPCWPISHAVEKAAKALDWDPFHQGGHHFVGEACTGRHYFEFWGLDGSGNYRQQVENFIKGVLHGLRRTN